MEDLWGFAGEVVFVGGKEFRGEGKVDESVY